MRVSGVVFSKGRIVLQLPQLVIDAAEAVEQAADIVEVGIVGGSQQNGRGLAISMARPRRCWLYARRVCCCAGWRQCCGYALTPHFEQAADAEDEVGVF